jgi:hypothetical protein
VEFGADPLTQVRPTSDTTVKLVQLTPAKSTSVTLPRVRKLEPARVIKVEPDSGAEAGAAELTAAERYAKDKPVEGPPDAVTRATGPVRAPPRDSPSVHVTTVGLTSTAPEQAIPAIATLTMSPVERASADEPEIVTSAPARAGALAGTMLERLAAAWR